MYIEDILPDKEILAGCWDNITHRIVLISVGENSCIDIASDSSQWPIDNEALRKWNLLQCNNSTGRLFD